MNIMNGVMNNYIKWSNMPRYITNINDTRTFVTNKRKKKKKKKKI